MRRCLIRPRNVQSAWFALAAAVALAGLFCDRAPAADPQLQSLFDGKTLAHWSGNPKFWRVEDGTIVGETTKENPTKGNTFLINDNTTTADFELTAEFKLIGGNSGIQYRSFEIPGSKWVVGGYQADMDGADQYTGCIYGERFRGMLCNRGEKTVIEADHRPKVVGKIGDSNEIREHIKKQDWNTYRITAAGFHFEQRINGVLTAVCDDDDVRMRRHAGILALQLHAGPPMKVQFRNIKFRALKPEEASSSSSRTEHGKKKIVFIAGKPSHGYAAHEHRAGCLLLAKALNENMPQVRAEVVANGWPANPHILDDADCIVVYADGGERHPLMAHLDEFDALMKRGIGLVCIHYAVEVPKGKGGERLSEWTGGYFEPNWSVNPHWTANYKKLPAHEITRGVKPFTINDEWYYHMRFLDRPGDVTPILTDLPPDSSLSRPDGTHSGNQAVRAAVARKEPQHMAWARQRPDGGRGFGITGGTFTGTGETTTSASSCSTPSSGRRTSTFRRRASRRLPSPSKIWRPIRTSRPRPTSIRPESRRC